jgi:hypothetical protein
MTFTSIIKILSVFLILLSVLVSIPLSIKVAMEGGGPWGFEVVSLAVLVPLNAYIFFGLAGLIGEKNKQRRIFIIAHAITIVCGLIGLFTFPVYPIWIPLIPSGLAIAGIISYKNYSFFLLIMILLGLAANIILLAWEIEFGRAVPLFQLFLSS